MTALPTTRILLPERWKILLLLSGRPRTVSSKFQGGREYLLGFQVNLGLIEKVFIKCSISLDQASLRKDLVLT